MRGSRRIRDSDTGHGQVRERGRTRKLKKNGEGGWREEGREMGEGREQREYLNIVRCRRFRFCPAAAAARIRSAERKPPGKGL